jgi:hypothetical protein
MSLYQGLNTVISLDVAMCCRYTLQYSDGRIMDLDLWRQSGGGSIIDLWRKVVQYSYTDQKYI